MDNCTITMDQKFQFIRFMDEARWKSYGNTYNYDIPNYFNKDMKREQKILTHFLGYITDRQTPFKLIFERLDFIFSQLVDDYVKGESPQTLLVDEDNKDCYFGKKAEGKYAFRERIKKDYKISQYPDVLDQLPKDERLCVASRFYPTDYIAILCTLEILSGYNRNIIDYIKRAIGKAAKKDDKLKCVLYALWLLGYADIGTWSKDKKNKIGKKNDQHIFSKKHRDDVAEKKGKSIKNFFEYGLSDKKYLDFLKNDRYKTKRVTCFLRDLLKFDHFSEMFKPCIGDEDFKDLKDQLKDLDLPGDVWNNNSTFRKCFLADSGNENKEPFNMIIRGLHDKEKNPEWYPEQLDCTFDFVPRMCEKQNETNCIHCPIKNDGKIPKDFCSSDGTKFCPFLLYACGYATKCKDIKEYCPNHKR